MYKDKKKYIIEIKLYNETNKVETDEIQEIHSAKINCKADNAIFVTTGKFTNPSVDYANKHKITLIDGKILLKLIDIASREEIPT